MADIDDLRLERTADPTRSAPPPPPKLPTWVPVASAALVLALLALWYFGMRSGPPAADTPKPTAETTVDLPSPLARLPAEPGEAIDVPPLDASDALVRSLISRLSAHPQIAAWLATDQLLRTITVVVTNIAGGETPAKHLQAIRPVGTFGVRQSGGEVWLDPASYRRYDNLAAAVESLDARGVARFYATVKPRLDEAFRDLGIPDADFDRTVERAIVMLLRTPIVEGDIRLRAESVSYKFADPALEGLAKAQRQFLRMGPANMRIVQAKLREVARHLGMADAALPPSERD
jgi:hypothetical protein